MFLENSALIIVWAIGITISVPLITILLGEIIERLKARNSKYVQSFELTRNLFVPVIVAFIIVRQILLIDGENLVYRVVTSVLLMSAAYLGFILFNAISGEKDVKRWENRVPGLFKTVLRVMVIVFPIYMLTGVWGIDLTSFVTALGVGSLVIALALQDTLSSIVSGFLLVIDKPFAVGDWVQVDGYKGQVVDISWRSTRLRVANDVVVIPNLTLAGSSIYNYTMMDISYRDELVLGFSYDDPPNKVKEVLLEMARDCSFLAQTPPPEVHTISYDDSSIGYRLYFHITEFTSAITEERIRDDLMTRVFYAAERNGLTIPFPISVEGRPQDFAPDTEKIEQEIFDFLKWNRYFSLLPDEILRRLAAEVNVSPFARTETILHKGTPGHSFGLIRSGDVVFLDSEQHHLNGSEPKYKLEVGDVVGEMILMGRRSNLATCVAKDDVVIFNFEPTTIQTIIEQHSRFAQKLNELIEERIDLFRENS
ncbi:MAG: mechanosensitive ion channel domain-containing protein [Anaerolineae bacterium]